MLDFMVYEYDFKKYIKVLNKKKETTKVSEYVPGKERHTSRLNIQIHVIQLIFSILMNGYCSHITEY